MRQLHPLSKLSLLAFVLLSLALQGCLKDKCDQTITYYQYTPIYMDETEFLESVKVMDPQDMVNPGKIFVKDDVLFVSETGVGVHIFDNANPAQPVPMAFINVPGNYDIHSSCDLLYLDSSTDLLVFDINRADQPRLLHRVRNALPHIVEFRGYTADPSQGVVISWEEEAITREYSCDGTIPDYVVANQIDPNNTDLTSLNNTRTVNPSTPGKAGSMSRFAIMEDYLYVVSPQNLQVLSLNNCTYPTNVSTQPINLPWGGEAEMVTVLDDLLLIGGTNGMAIYSAENPEAPNFLSVFEHMQACDPVAASEGFAYVTLRQDNSSENGCGMNFSNQLDVIDIQDPSQPFLINSVGMVNPHGVGIDNDLLFIADGSAGLKVYDARDPYDVGRNIIAEFPEMFGFDVIPYNNLLIMTGEDGISMYDYSSPDKIQHLSTIPVVSP